GLGDLLDLANLGGGPPQCPLCTFDPQRPFEPILPGPYSRMNYVEPVLNYLRTTVRSFLGDQDPNSDGTADNAKAFNAAITSPKSFMIVSNTGHTVESTAAGVEAYVGSVRAALPEISTAAPFTYTIANPGG